MIKACRGTLHPPQRSGHPLDPVEVSVLVAQEMDPPKGEEPVTWILLSNLEVTSFEQAVEKIQWYLCRWQIEIYFRILKFSDGLTARCEHRIVGRVVMHDCPGNSRRLVCQCHGDHVRMFTSHQLVQPLAKTIVSILRVP